MWWDMLTAKHELQRLSRPCHTSLNFFMHVPLSPTQVLVEHTAGPPHHEAGLELGAVSESVH
jgi:hypothetical protein